MSKFPPLQYRSHVASAAERQDFVPKDHVSRFSVGLARESLDFKEIAAATGVGSASRRSIRARRSRAACTAMRVGSIRPRRIARACRERNDFAMIVALDPPTSTISDFRKRHLKALGALFLQVLKLCEERGWSNSATSPWMARKSK